MAFDRLDANGDGWLSLDELMEQLPSTDGSTDAGAHCRRRSCGGRRPARVQAASSCAGAVPTFVSASPAAASLHLDVAAERMLEARRMLREADTNGDGRIRCGARGGAAACSATEE